MKKTDNNEASHAQVSGEPCLSGQHEATLSAYQAKDVARQENAGMENETADSSRKKLVVLREDTVEFRENAAYVREEAAQRREEAVSCREQLNYGLNAEHAQRNDAANLRENAVCLREDSAHLREDTVILRERQVRAAEDTVGIGPDHALSISRQANSQLIVSIIEAQKLAEQVETAKTKLHHLAHHDALTGLPNRMLLQDRLNQAIELARRQGRRFAVLFMDLDRFKQINDSLGHAVGDQLLQSVAQCLAGCLRHSDTLGRQGGDEFVVLLSNIMYTEDAALIAQNMLIALTAPHLIDNHELHISASIGIGVYPDDGQDAEALLKSADSAMYHAKEGGRNSYKFFENAMNVEAVRRQSIETQLHRALEREEFVLHYQPKINLHTNMVVGAEALIRWQHPEWGLMPPSQFVPIAEDCGLILPMGRWVLREACRQAIAWRQNGLPPITVAVNTSTLEFSAKDFLENLYATLRETNLEPHYLELELTESVLMRDVDFTNSILHELTALGVKLVIDDFGIGYSSLSYLRQFPIDTLKIDQSFVRRMTSSPDDAAIVSAVIGLGKSLKLRLIAEGVETFAQHAFLLAQHCDEGQGYYYGRPMAAKMLISLLPPN